MGGIALYFSTRVVFEILFFLIWLTGAEAESSQHASFHHHHRLAFSNPFLVASAFVLHSAYLTFQIQ